MNTLAPANDYLQKSRELIDIVEHQLPEIQRAADWFAQSILAGRMVHIFGSGHSRIMVEEMWPRYGSFPGFNPIVELSLSFHNLVVGPNGQRQAMFLENASTGRFGFRDLFEWLQSRSDRNGGRFPKARPQGRSAD
jgi:hypothetical protein